MNILIPDSWLKEHLKTKASAKQIAEYLSLCSQSVEKTTKTGFDVVYEIEITTNRPDCLSVYGIARELSAILPRFDIPAKLIPIQDTRFKIQEAKNSLPLNVKITDPSFCPRFTALIFDNIKIGPSPKIVQDRLVKSGIRALDNVVDISNYLMLELGQPMHTFDYDKIKGAKMILREAKMGEKVVTLDGQIRNLAKGAVIIEDGDNRIIDLCGIMGAENSAVDQNTKRVLLFIQTYDPQRIRRTCQLMGFRTEAASRFEKSVDPEGVIIAMKKAIQMFKDNCQARIASNIIDIYPNPPKPKTVSLGEGKLNEIMGIPIKLTEAKKILESLGFQSAIKQSNNLTINVSVPHWRYDDISIPEDLIEEVARVWGYHHLPNNLPPGPIPQTIKEKVLVWSEIVKTALKFWGFTEMYNFSFTSEQNLRKTGINPAICVKIANPLSEEWTHMRPSLAPSLFEAAAKNQDNFKEIKIFELANIYLPVSPQKLPNEIPTLSGLMTQTDFYAVKGVIESLLSELGIKALQFKQSEKNLFSPSLSAQISYGKEILGNFGEIETVIAANFNLPKDTYFFELNFAKIAELSNPQINFDPIPKYPAIIEDLSFVVPPKTQVGKIIQFIKSVNPIVEVIDLLDTFKDGRTFRITYRDQQKTLNEGEVRNIREKIIIEMKRKNFGTLKENPSG